MTHRVSVAADFVLVVFFRAAGAVRARVGTTCDVDLKQFHTETLSKIIKDLLFH